VTAPPAAVLEAFRCPGVLAPLAGGRGLSWRSGDVVLKPAEENPLITDWLCDVLDRLVPDGFRISSPIRAATGDWRFDGWTASRFEPGTPADVTGGPWIDVLRAGAAFGRALAGVERPWFTTLRDDPWAVADRVAWQEESVELPSAYDAVVRRLAALAGDRPEDPDQVVHCDLPGNVLLHPGLEPLILDFSPFWRPVRYSLAVVVTDALAWHGAGPSLLVEARPFLGGASLNYLTRSLMFRTVVAGLWAAAAGGSGAGGSGADADLQGFARVADQLTTFAAAG
jgi:uncharacterized protein (TIGR02569 family)